MHYYYNLTSHLLSFHITLIANQEHWIRLQEVALVRAALIQQERERAYIDRLVQLAKQKDEEKQRLYALLRELRSEVSFLMSEKEREREQREQRERELQARLQVAADIGHCLDILRVQDRGNLDVQKVNQAFRKRALELHPDKHQGATDEEISNLNEMFSELSVAKDFLLSQVRSTRPPGF
jgi:hypothetical protein